VPIETRCVSYPEKFHLAAKYATEGPALPNLSDADRVLLHALYQQARRPPNAPPAQRAARPTRRHPNAPPAQRAARPTRRHPFSPWASAAAPLGRPRSGRATLP
jgi:hypothetical protein